MRKILLASHACLASGMKSSVEMVTGPQEHLSLIHIFIQAENFQEFQTIMCRREL